MSEIAAKATPTVTERYLFKPFRGSSHEWILTHLRGIDPSKRLLDIGSGPGTIGQALVEQGARELYAVEIDPGAVAAAAPYYRRIARDVAEFRGEKFDMILLLDILEHLPDPFGYLSEVSALLSPGGKIYISLPNIAHWSVRFQLLFGFFAYQDRGILDRTHLQFFTRKRFRELARSCQGLRLIEESATIEPLEFILPKWAYENGLFRTLSALRLALAKALPGLFAYQHLGVLERAQ